MMHEQFQGITEFIRERPYVSICYLPAISLHQCLFLLQGDFRILQQAVPEYNDQRTHSTLVKFQFMCSLHQVVYRVVFYLIAVSAFPFAAEGRELVSRLVPA